MYKKLERCETGFTGATGVARVAVCERERKTKVSQRQVPMINTKHMI